MGKDSQIDKYIQNMRHGTSGGSLIDGLDEEPKETKKPKKVAASAPAAEKFEPTFEQRREVEKIRTAHRFGNDKKDPAEKTRRTVGVEMTEEEIYRIDKATYMLKMTKRELIRTAVLEYLEAHNA